MGLRSETSGFMLRIGKDQEAYDFAKWWATCDPHGKYDCGDITIPYLSIKDADASESETRVGVSDMDHTIAMILIKFRLLYKLQSLLGLKAIYTGLILETQTLTLQNWLTFVMANFVGNATPSVKKLKAQGGIEKVHDRVKKDLIQLIGKLNKQISSSSKGLSIHKRYCVEVIPDLMHMDQLSMLIWGLTTTIAHLRKQLEPSTC
ncbi:hypothetical protein HK098_003600 [Nowakowskiella sp. JEL0407]|nr:hypothetical protein HK098_003600 [Nowakowskiella sp. JEL0407]